MDTRLHVVGWGAGQPRKRTSTANWRLPVKWNAEPFIECGSCSWRGEKRAFFQPGPLGGRWTMCPSCAGSDWIPARRRVFCASLADVFDNEVPPAWRGDLLQLIDATPNLDWLLLTKRIGNVMNMVAAVAKGALEGTELHRMTHLWLAGSPPRNVWLGATIVDQAEADRDIPKLLATPAALRFLSMEPLLGPVTLNPWLLSEHGRRQIGAGAGIGWVIVGGESGHHARPMHPDWARSLQQQCSAAGVPLLFKQHGEWMPVGKDPNEAQRLIFLHARPTARCYSWPDGETLVLAGKKAAGRLLDGRTHDGFPEGAHG